MFEFFNKPPTQYRCWEPIIYFKWQKRGSLSSFGLLQDGAFTDSFENFSVNGLMGDLSNVTSFNPPLFSLVNTFNHIKAFEYHFSFQYRETHNLVSPFDTVSTTLFQRRYRPKKRVEVIVHASFCMVKWWQIKRNLPYVCLTQEKGEREAWC